MMLLNNLFAVHSLAGLRVWALLALESFKRLSGPVHGNEMPHVFNDGLY